MTGAPTVLPVTGPAEPVRLPERAGQTSPEQPWPVRVLSQHIAEYIGRMPETWVEGQVIEFNRRARAAYLTLRDVEAEVSLPVAVWTSVLDRLEAPLREGARVVARIKPDFWLKTGRMSMRASDIRPVGLGDLLARIEALRRVLAAEGLFAAERKKPLPFLPQLVGLICGRDSDAEKDVVRNARRRWPAVEFRIRQVAVQGANAVPEVTRALAELDADPEVDVIVIARGGGALEDLLAFSNESLVRAAAAATTPLVSAIGHEADRPLLDEVADLRASTPTDAAKRIVPDLAEELAGVADARRRLDAAVGRRLDRADAELAGWRTRPVLAEPLVMVTRRAEEIEQWRARGLRFMTVAVDRARDRIEAQRAQVRGLSPLNTLRRGYAVVQAADRTVVTDPRRLAPAQDLVVTVAHGSFSATAGETISIRTIDSKDGEEDS